MVLPIEDETKEVVENDSMLHIHNGRIAAWRALSTYKAEGLGIMNDVYVPDISPTDRRLDDMSLQSFNVVRNTWSARFSHWKHPDLAVIVEGTPAGSIYTYVTKLMTRYSDHSQATLF